NLPPELVATIANVAKFDHVVFLEFALDTCGPGLDVTRLQVWIEGVGRIRNKSRIGIAGLGRKRPGTGSARTKRRRRGKSVPKQRPKRHRIGRTSDALRSVDSLSRVRSQ